MQENLCIFEYVESNYFTRHNDIGVNVCEALYTQYTVGSCPTSLNFCANWFSYISNIRSLTFAIFSLLRL